MEFDVSPAVAALLLVFLALLNSAVGLLGSLVVLTVLARHRWQQAKQRRTGSSVRPVHLAVCNEFGRCECCGLIADADAGGHCHRCAPYCRAGHCLWCHEICECGHCQACSGSCEICGCCRTCSSGTDGCDCSIARSD